MTQPLNPRKSLTRLKPLLCLMTFSLSACVSTAPGGTTGTPSANPSASPTALASINPSPTPAPTESPTPMPSSESPSAMPTDPEPLPAQLNGLRFGTINRFLESKGDQTRFSVELLDAQDQVFQAQVPLEWNSSRPQDFGVDPDGQITALVDYGYSLISVRIPGTSFLAQAVINVSAGAGSRSSQPVQEPLVTVNLTEAGYY